MDGDIENSRELIRRKITEFFMEKWKEEAIAQTPSWKKWRATLKASIEYLVFHEKHQDE